MTESLNDAEESKSHDSEQSAWWKQDNPGILWIAEHQVNGGRKTVAQIVSEIKAKTSQLQLYDNIVLSADLEGTPLEKLIQVIISEAQQVEPQRKLDAVKRLSDAADAVTGPSRMTVMSDERWKSILELIPRMLNDHDMKVRRAVIEVLGKCLNASEALSVKLLAENGITNDDSETAASAIKLLRDAGRDEASAAVPSLIKALNHKSDKVQEEACDTLGWLSEDSLKAVPTLIMTLLKTKSNRVIASAIRALLKIQTRERTIQLIVDKTFNWDNLLAKLRIDDATVSEFRRDLIKERQQRQDIASQTSDKAMPGDPNVKNEKLNVNSRLTNALNADPEKLGWSAAKLALFLGCSKSTVAETKFWKTIQEMREEKRRESIEKHQALSQGSPRDDS